MMEYKCPRCHYTVSSKTHYVKHLSRKNICNAEHEDIPPDTLLKELMDKELEKAFVCSTCQSRFTHKTSLYRHIRSEHTTSGNAVHSNNASHTEHSHNTTTEHSHNTDHNHHNTTTADHSHNTTTTNTQSYNTNSLNNTTNNYNITINLAPYGEHSVNHVEENLEQLSKCLKDILGNGVPNVVEMIHMDPNQPQNHNVKLKRIKYPGTMMVYVRDPNGEKKWVEWDLNTALHKLVIEGTDILIRHNNKSYTEDELPNDDKEELFDLHREQLTKVRQKNKFVYGKVKNGVLSKFKDQRKEDIIGKEGTTT